MLNVAETDTWQSAENLPEQPASVLIVDDDALAAEELAETLELEGFTCIATHTYSGALAALEQNPDIKTIITDFYLRGDSMAVGNGLELIEHARETFPDRKLDFIVVSGDPDVLADCTISGAGKFLAKPIAPASICTMVKESSAHLIADEPSESGDGSILMLHRMIEDQASAIASLTEALTSARDGKRNAGSRLDRLVSAASIAAKRSEVSGERDVGDLIRYIVGQGYAVKKILGNTEKKKERPTDGVVKRIDG